MCIRVEWGKNVPWILKKLKGLVHELRCIIENFRSLVRRGAQHRVFKMKLLLKKMLFFATLVYRRVGLYFDNFFTFFVILQVAIQDTMTIFSPPPDF